MARSLLKKTIGGHRRYLLSEIEAMQGFEDEEQIKDIMMTRKHFRKIAEAIREMVENGQNPQELANKLADLCQEESPRFSREKFLEACGLVCP